MCLLRGFRKVSFLILGASGFILMVCLLIQSSAAVLRSNIDKPTEPAKGDPIIRLPIEVPGTTLVAHRLIRYESETEVPITAIQLENTGELEIVSARVILCWEQGAYVFDVSSLQSGATAIVLENDRQPYEIYLWTACNGVQKSLIR